MKNNYKVLDVLKNQEIFGKILRGRKIKNIFKENVLLNLSNKKAKKVLNGNQPLISTIQ